MSNRKEHEGEHNMNKALLATLLLFAMSASAIAEPTKYWDDRCQEIGYKYSLGGVVLTGSNAETFGAGTTTSDGRSFWIAGNHTAFTYTSDFNTVGLIILDTTGKTIYQGNSTGSYSGTNDFITIDWCTNDNPKHQGKKK